MPAPKNLDLGDWNQAVDSFNKESDRGAAILAGSFAEHSLGLYLRYRMRNAAVADELFSAMGPLSSFAQRVAIAYAFGFIPKTHHQDFGIVRRIRNHFAHHPLDTTFDTPEVRQMANGLSMIEHAKKAAPRSLRRRARVAYLLTCAWLCGTLLNAIEEGRTEIPEVKKQK